MAIYTGKVVDGVIQPYGVLLPEGTKVTILVPEDAEPFDLTPEMIAELDQAVAEMDRGDSVPAEVVLDELRRGPGV